MAKKKVKVKAKALRKKIQRVDHFFVYIVKCKNGTFYTGYTNNLEARIKLHNSGRGAKYLRGKLPVRLVYTKAFCYYKSALNEERRIKTLLRKKKLELIKEYRNRKKKYEK